MPKFYLVYTQNLYGLTTSKKHFTHIQLARTWSPPRRNQVGKIDRKGVAYGLGAIIEGHDAPGIRDWIPDVEFLGVRMFTRELPESIVYTIPKKKFHALLREGRGLFLCGCGGGGWRYGILARLWKWNLVVFVTTPSYTKFFPNCGKNHFIHNQNDHS